MTEAQIKLLADLRSGAVRLVPNVPTLEMQKAYFDEIDRNMRRVETDLHFGRFDNHRVAYGKMLAASPDLASLAEMIEGLVEQVEYWPETSKHWEARALASDSRVSELQAENEKLTRQLRALAVALHSKHYADVPQWRPLEDAEGLLSQIDNMTTGLARALAKDHPNGQG